jgi:hypothetical protein
MHVDRAGDGLGAYSFRILDLSTAAPLTLGSTVAGNLTPASETDAYQFSATAGESFFFNLQQQDDMPNASWRLVGPTGIELYNQSISSGDVDTLTIPLTGQYTLLIEGYVEDTGTGTYAFQVSSVPNNPPIALALNSTIAGSIDVLGESDTYTFDLSSDSQLYFDSLTNDDNVRWTLTGPLGIAVSNAGFASSDWFFYEPLSQLRLPAGSYTMNVDRSGDGVGVYSFRMLDLSTAATLTLGSTVTGNLTPASETDAYQFSATAGNSVFFDLQQQDNMPNASWRLVGPTGIELYTQWMSSGDVDTLTIPLTGQYTLLVEGNLEDTGTGTYGFQVSSVPNNPPIALALNATIVGSIDFLGESDTYTFDLSSDSQLYFDSLTNDDNVTWTLSGPLGIAVINAGFASSDWYYEPLSQLRLPAGSYTMHVDRSGDGLGGYSFRMLDLSTAAPLTLGSTVTGSLTPSFETDAYQFSAAAWDHFSFNSTVADPQNASWQLLDPYGAVIFSTGLGDSQADVALTYTGEYTLLVGGYIADTGSIDYALDATFLFNDPPAPSTGTLLALDTVVSSTIANPGVPETYIFELATDKQLYFDSLTNDDNVRWTLASQTGLIIENASFAYSDWLYYEPLSELKLPAGQYQLSIGGTGNFSFKILDLSTTTPLTVGSVVTGDLTPASETDAYQFSATAGDSFFFDLQQQDNMPEASWRLIGPTGIELYNQWMNYGDVDRLTVPLTGQYTLLVEGYIGDTGAGTYGFQVFSIPENTPIATALNSTIAGTIDIPGESNSYTFDLTSNTQLYFDSLTNDDNVRWTLSGPLGIAVSNAGFAFSDWFYEPLSQLRLPAGSYTMNVDRAGDGVGAYNFRLLDLSSAAPLTVGSPVTGDLTPGFETDAYQFSATAGESLFFDLQLQDNIPNASWRLLGPTGVEIYNQSLNWGDVDTLTVPLTGQYTLLIEGYLEDSGTGTYSFQVSSVPNNPPTAMALNATIDGSIDVPGESNSYTFDLTSDRQLYFDSLTNDGNVHWTLTGPLGTAVNATSFANSDWFSEPLSQLRLPAGSYTLTVARSGDGVGGYSFRMLDLATAASLTVDSVVTGSLTLPQKQTLTSSVQQLATASFLTCNSKTTCPMLVGD